MNRFQPLRRSMWRLLSFALCVVSPLVSQADEPTPEAIEFFEKKIRPIFVSHCYECHSVGQKKANGGLTVDSGAALRKGGDSGPAIVPGDVEKSLLIAAVRYADKDLRMPPKEKLTATQIADLEQWVKTGAADPRPVVVGEVVAKPSSAKYGMSLDEGKRFWSFQPVRDPAIPAVKNSKWPRNEIDRFVLARGEALGVAPNPPADLRTLLRRVTFDLTGLPPTPEEMAAFLHEAEGGDGEAAKGSADKKTNATTLDAAFARVIDRLLDSPRYGERWGRHWLDVVRYADTCGNASDYPVPQAMKYRDWVVRAFNRDLPYDQFLREQIAGDLLPSDSDEQRYERTVATGYLAISRRFGGDRFGEHHLTLEDTIDNLGRAILGATLSCARCHDHKFDPFTMHDYYGLYGIFSSTRYPFPGAEVKKEQEDFVPLMSAAAVEALLKPHREKLAALDAEIKQLDAAEAAAKKLPDGPDKKPQVDAAVLAAASAKKRRTELQKNPPTIHDAYAVAEGKPANAKMQLRGDPKRLGDEEPRHFPAVFGGQSLAADATGSGRLQLADWVTDPSNPRTARVIVNRVWQFHFGKGLVPTPNDFGRQGQPPTHPELLDFLAARLIESGWSIKSLHKLILQSNVWRQSSADSETNLKLDPSNETLWRFSRRRLDAESIRDSLLFVSGELDESSPAEHPFPAKSSWGYTQHNPFVATYESKRRSVYLMQQRLRKHPYLALFDGADPSSSTGARLQSTTPLQALFMMNDSLAHASAAKFATRVRAAGTDDASRIAAAYEAAWNRTPTPDDQTDCTKFLNDYREQLAKLKTPADQVETKTWEALARAMLSANEFLYVE